MHTDLDWFDRIVMCGLPGKKATNFEAEQVRGKSVEEVARVFAELVAEGLKDCDEVVRIVREDEVLGNG